MRRGNAKPKTTNSRYHQAPQSRAEHRGQSRWDPGHDDNGLRSSEKGIGNSWELGAGGVGDGEVMESEAEERDTIFS